VESRERFAKALHLIRRAWTETRPFGWLGHYYQYCTISIWPRPTQQPHPPLSMSGSSPEAEEFAARNHIGIGFAVTTVPLAMARRERSPGRKTSPTNCRAITGISLPAAVTGSSSRRSCRLIAWRSRSLTRPRKAAGSPARSAAC